MLSCTGINITWVLVHFVHSIHEVDTDRMTIFPQLLLYKKTVFLNSANIVRISITAKRYTCSNFYILNMLTRALMDLRCLKFLSFAFLPP